MDIVISYAFRVHDIEALREKYLIVATSREREGMEIDTDNVEGMIRALQTDLDIYALETGKALSWDDAGVELISDNG
jgi:hypothetical protein